MRKTIASSSSRNGRTSRTATIISGMVITAAAVGLAIMPMVGLPTDQASAHMGAVSETVSPKQITQYCPSQMVLADNDTYGDAAFHVSTGNLTSERTFAAFGAIFHAQTNTFASTNTDQAQVLQSQVNTSSTDAAYIAASSKAKDAVVFDTRVLNADAGTGAVGAIGSWASEGDLLGASASSCITPQLVQQFFVPSTATGNTQQLVIANPSDKPTTVDVNAWNTKDGAIALATNSTVTVQAQAQTTVMLNAAAPNQEALYVRVQSADTAVSAFIRSIAMDGLTAQGNDFITPLTQTGTQQAMPLGSTQGGVIHAFSQKDTTVALSWVTEHGLVALDTMHVAANKVATYTAKDAPDDAYAIYAQSDDQCALAMLISENGEQGQRDYAIVPASSAVSQSALALPNNLDATVTIVNMDGASSKVNVQGFDAQGQRVGSKEITIDANSASTLPVSDISEDAVALRIPDAKVHVVWGAALRSHTDEQDNIASIAYLAARALTIPQQTVTARADASIVR